MLSMECRIKYGILITCLILWAVRYFAWSAPDATLEALNLESLMKIELGVSLIVGGAMTLWIRKNKRTYNNSFFYWVSQVVSSALFLVPALLLIAALIGIVVFSVDL